MNTKSNPLLYNLKSFEAYNVPLICTFDNTAQPVLPCLDIVTPTSSPSKDYGT